MKVMRLYVWSLVVAEDDVVSAVDKVANDYHDHHLDHDDDAITMMKMTL